MKFVGYNKDGVPVFVKSRKERKLNGKYEPHQGKKECERRKKKDFLTDFLIEELMNDPVIKDAIESKEKGYVGTNKTRNSKGETE